MSVSFTAIFGFDFFSNANLRVPLSQTHLSCMSSISIPSFGNQFDSTTKEACKNTLTGIIKKSVYSTQPIVAIVVQNETIFDPR